VQSLRQRVEEEPGRWRPLVERLGELAEAAVGDVRLGRLEALGAHMDEAQAGLASASLSSPELDAIVAAARQAGALGAKLTGAGGGGAAIALVREATPVVRAIEGLGFAARAVEIG
jgi:mevalonate kinase